MEKRLKWSTIQTGFFEDGRAKLEVLFLDNQANLYRWTPGWAQVEELFLKGLNTEKFNKPKGDWVKRFAQTSHEVFQRSMEHVVDAHKVSGRLEQVKDGELIVVNYTPFDMTPEGWETGIEFPVRDEEGVKPAFPITEDFLMNYLGKEVSCLVINDIAVKIWLSE